MPLAAKRKNPLRHLHPRRLHRRLPRQLLRLPRLLRHLLLTPPNRLMHPRLKRRKTALPLPRPLPPPALLLAPLLVLLLVLLPARMQAPLLELQPALLPVLPWKKARKWSKTLPKMQ